MDTWSRVDCFLFGVAVGGVAAALLISVLR